MKITSFLVIMLLVCSTAASAAEKAKSTPGDKKKSAAVKPKPLPTALMKQSDLAREVLTVFGWDGGLSEEPKDREYLQILEGRRTFKFEAEKVYNVKTDDVSLRKNQMFGPFSGESWISGISTPSPVRLKVFIPVGGEYLLSAAARGDGQIWKIAGKEYPANSGGGLTLTKITTVSIKPGELEFEMLLPPEGALDYLLFTAPDYTPLEPLDGWRFNEPLTNLALAQVGSSLLGLDGNLPPDGAAKPVTVVVSEMQGLPAGASLTDRKYYGKFSGKSWVSTEGKSADIDIPFTVPQSGAYDLKLRIMGKTFSGSLDGNPFSIQAKPSLDWVSLGLHRLSQGSHTVTVTVPPFAGIDALDVTPRNASPEAYMKLAGITGDPQAVLTYAEMERYLSLWRTKFTTRK